MSSEQFCLRWNNHHPNLISVFSSLLQNDQMVDVTLISEEREIHAHKIVLSACSPFFQSIFLKNSCKHPVIVLTDIKFEHLRNLIDFIYNGKVNIFEENLPELLRIANILKIKGLVSEIDNDLSDTEEFEQNIDESKQDDNNSDDGFSLNALQNLKKESTETDDVDASSGKSLQKSIANEQIKSLKKRKSVSFSETPEIVQLDSFSTLSALTATHSNDRKRKLRSSAEMCTITKVSQTDNFHDINKIGESSESIISEFSMLPSTHRDGCIKIEPISGENVIKKPRCPTSRKMIRKNENFLRALEAVRTQGIGFCKAAKIHGVNNRTLWLEYQKLGYPMKNARKKSNQ